MMAHTVFQWSSGEQTVTDEKPSRSEKKRQVLALQELGERLSCADQALWDALGIPQDLVNALQEKRSITSFQARKRHLQFIGRLMRDLDSDMVRKIAVALKERP